ATVALDRRSVHGPRPATSQRTGAGRRLGCPTAGSVYLVCQPAGVAGSLALGGEAVLCGHGRQLFASAVGVPHAAGDSAVTSAVCLAIDRQRASDVRCRLPVGVAASVVAVSAAGSPLLARCDYSTYAAGRAASDQCQR